MSWPRIAIVGAGAAGLWCALRLVERGCPGELISLIEPEAKDADDRTWSYWTHQQLLPPEVVAVSFSKIEIASGDRHTVHDTLPYSYESLRSSAFYAFAKTRLASAGVKWLAGRVVDVEEGAQEVRVSVQLNAGGTEVLVADYVLDSRLSIAAADQETHISLGQPFGGWYVEADREVFDPTLMTFMDFPAAQEKISFFYVIPQSPTVALVEIAEFTNERTPATSYDQRLAEYLQARFGLQLASGQAKSKEEVLRKHTSEPEEGAEQAQTSHTAARGAETGVKGFGDKPILATRIAHAERANTAKHESGSYRILERENAYIPMSDYAYWQHSTQRVWKIGTAGGWVQMSSGYAFTRIARFADEVALSLGSPRPQPWRPPASPAAFQHGDAGAFAAASTGSSGNFQPALRPGRCSDDVCFSGRAGHLATNFASDAGKSTARICVAHAARAAQGAAALVTERERRLACR